MTTREQFEETWSLVVDLLPADVRKTLFDDRPMGYFIPSFDEWAWPTIRKLVAQTFASEEVDRAPCPLCHDTPQQQDRGFTPVSLERHLGSYGNQRCRTMELARWLFTPVKRWGPYVEQWVYQDGYSKR